MEVDRYTFIGEEFRRRLVAGGKFNEIEAVAVVDIMLERGRIEKVSYDTYRLKK